MFTSSKAAQALAAGIRLTLKPAETTQRSSLKNKLEVCPYVVLLRSAYRGSSRNTMEFKEAREPYGIVRPGSTFATRSGLAGTAAEKLGKPGFLAFAREGPAYTDTSTCLIG